MYRFSRVVIFALIWLFASVVNSEQPETPYEELLNILRSQWLYELNEEEIHKCVLIHMANTMSFPVSIPKLPSCFTRDPYISLKFSINHPALLPDKKTPITALLHIEAVPSKLDGVLFGRITMTRKIPDGAAMDEYFLSHLTRMRNADINAFVINLNGNIGGFVEGAAAFLQYFAEVNTVEQFLFEIQKRAVDPVRYVATERGVAAGACLAVMVNKHTTSAAEIIAYALQQQMTAHVVGEVTYKKGVVQNKRSLQNGAEVLFTSGKVFFPDGTTIHKRGVVPNFITNDEHIQTEEAQKYLHDCYTKKITNK